MKYMAFILWVCFLILFAVVTPPFQVPDEFNHFYRVVGISQGNFYCNTKSGQPGHDIDNEYLNYASLFSKAPFKSHEKFAPSEIKESLKFELRGAKQFVVLSNTCQYNPVGYLPQIITFKVSSLFSNNVAVHFYSARIGAILFNLFILGIAIFLVAADVWWLPFFYATIPMLIFEAASISLDSMQNSLAILLLALFTRTSLNSTRNMKWPIWLIAIPTIFFFSVCKVVYFLIPFVFPALLNNNLSSRRKLTRYLLLASAFSVIYVGLWLVTTRLQLHVNRGDVAPGAINPVDQLHFILTEPFSYLKVVFRTFNRSWQFYFNSMIGQFGWLDTSLQPPLYRGYGLFFIFFILRANFLFRETLRIRQRLLILAVMMISILGIVTASYLDWTPIRGNLIEGTQGRYFLPLAWLILMIGFSVPRLSQWLSRVPTSSWLLVCFFYLSNSLCVLIFRYYGINLFFASEDQLFPLLDNIFLPYFVSLIYIVSVFISYFSVRNTVNNLQLVFAIFKQHFSGFIFVFTVMIFSTKLSSLVDWFFAGYIFFGIIMVFFFETIAVVRSSFSLGVLATVDELNGNASETNIRNRFADGRGIQFLVSNRLENMILNGLVEKNGSQLQISKKGIFIAKATQILRSLYTHQQ